MFFDSLNKRFQNWKVITCASFLWGLIAHGYCFFNKFSTSDDIGRFNLAGTYVSGRWMLGELQNLYNLFFGADNFSTPWFNGFVSILFISLFSILILDLLGITEKKQIALCCGVLTVFPVITSLFGYMFTAPYYMIGTFIGVLGIWLIENHCSVVSFVCGALLVSCSIGVYQANLPFCVSILLLVFIKKTVEGNLNIRQFIRWGLFYSLFCISFLVLYVLINRIELKINGKTMINYSSISSFGITSVKGYFERIKLAYSDFVMPSVSDALFPMAVKYYYRIALLIGLALSVALIIQQIKKSIANGILVCALLVLLPLAFNLIFVIMNHWDMHSLVHYSKALFFVYVIWIQSELTFNSKIPIGRITVFATEIILFLTCVVYCKFDNICYLKAECFQEETKSYCDTLISRIKSIENYDDELHVVFVGEACIDDKTVTSIPEFDVVQIIPYGRYGINSSTLKRMAYWNGFSPSIENVEDFKDLPEVTEMPCYPDYDSIRIIDNTIVVKFSNTVPDTSYWDEIERKVNE